MDDVQLYLIGVVASVLVWIYKFLRGRGVEISAKLLTNLVFVVGGVLAFFFAPLVLPAFPPFVDLATFVPLFIEWVGDLLVPLSAFVGFAVMIYNNLLKLVLDKIGQGLRALRAAKG